MGIEIEVVLDVVRVTWKGPVDDDGIRAYFDRIGEIASRGAPYAIVYDVREASLPSGRQRRLLAELTRTHAPAFRTNCVGIAFVIDSILIRSALVALLWLEPMEVDHAVMASLGEARHWVDERLRASSRVADPSRGGPQSPK